MAALPEFLDPTVTSEHKFGYYADDHCGNRLARVGLDYDTFAKHKANLVVSGYEVTPLSLTQQVALLLHEAAP